MSEGEFERTEAEALLHTRRELGAQYDAELVQSFADRIERVVEERTRASSRLAVLPSSGGGNQLALGIVSIVGGIPITAISAGIADLPGLVVAWGGIAAVNMAHAWQGRHRF